MERELSMSNALSTSLHILYKLLKLWFGNTSWSVCISTHGWRGRISHRNYISSTGNDIVFITPLSGLSAKKVKPKSITFDKQCLVWLPYLSLCRALLRTAWGEGKRKNTMSTAITGSKKKGGKKRKVQIQYSDKASIVTMLEEPWHIA